MPTFEEVDKHVKKFKLQAKPTSQAEAGAQLCGVYHSVKPILTLLLSLPILPAKWKAVGDSFIGVLDVFCPDADAVV